MKKMKKILGLGRKRKEQPSPARLGPSASFGSACAASGGYKVRSKDLGKLHRAAAEGDVGELRQLLQKHDLNEQDKCDRTALHLACANGYTDIVTFLVDSKCQVNICDNDKRSPLMKAVQCQQEFCAIYLLEHGADPTLEDTDNNTALHFAACNSSISIAKHLLEHKAHIEAQNTDGSTPLIVAVAENNREMVEFLLKKGASVHATDKSGRTPLLVAACNKRRDITNVLLLHGSDVLHKDESGWSAKDYAMISDDPILIQYIAEYSKMKNREEDSTDDQKVLSVLSSPEKAGITGIMFGAPATNKEDREMQQSLNQTAGDSGKVIDDHSSGDSVKDSGKTDDDSWLSSEEEELDFSPKKPQKPSLAQLMNVSQQLKKNNNDSENNKSSKEKVKPGLQRNVNSNKQELNDPKDSSASNEEEEFDEEEDEEEEVEEEEEEEEEEEAEEEEDEEEEGEEEMEDDFSEEKEDENIEVESQDKIENEEEEYFKKSEGTEAFANNECEGKGNNSNNKIYDAHNEEMQESGDIPVSFIAGHYECADENTANSRLNNELPNNSFEKENSYKYEDQFQNPDEFQGSETNNEIVYENQKGFHKNVISSLETSEATTLAGAAFSSLLSSNHNKGMNSNLGDSIEKDDDAGSESELEKRNTKEQNSKNPEVVDYQNIKEKQRLESKEPEEAIYETQVYQNENSEEENVKTFQPDIKEEEEEEEEEEEDEEEDGEKENQNISIAVDKRLICNGNSHNQNPSQGGIVGKAASTLGMDEQEEQKGTESPWDSECTSESPRKPTIGSLPTSPAKIRTQMHSITEEPCGGKSDDLQPRIAKTNWENNATPNPIKGTEAREKQKSDLMEELGLDDADDIEDASDWDSTSISLKSVPCTKSFNSLMLGKHASPLQLAKGDAAIKTPVPVTAEELADVQTVIASKDEQCNELKSIKEFESDENKDKSVIDTPNSIEKTPEKQIDKTEISYTQDERKTGALIHNEESNSECRHFVSTLWEERYEKMWVANEKREVKTNFKSITAELKQMFGEINVSRKISNTSTEGRSRDGFGDVLDGIEESPSPHLSKAMVDIQGKGDTAELKSVIAEKEFNTENSILYPHISISQNLFKMCENGKQNTEQNLNTNDEVLSNNAEHTKVNISGGKCDNIFVQLETNVGENTTCPDYSPMHSCKDIVSDTNFTTTYIKQPVMTVNTNTCCDIVKGASQETPHHFNNGVSSCKYFDTEIGNKVKNSEQSCHQTCQQTSKKELDDELERDVARFKNEVGMLQIVFLALEKEKAQLQKEVEEEKRKQELEAEGKEAVNIENKVAVVIEQKMEQKPTLNENQHIKIEGEIEEESKVINRISSPDRTGLIPVTFKGKSPTASMKDVKKSEIKRRISKQRVSQQIAENLHQLEDDSSLSEASPEEERHPPKTVNGKNKIYRAMGVANDFDDLTQSSDTATEDIELPTLVYREAMILIEQLSLDSKDSVSLLKIQNIFHGYERLIEHEKGRYTQLLGKVKKLENEKKEQQRILEEMREMKSMLDHQKVDRESDISSLKFSLKQEEEKRMSAEMLYEKNQEQLRKKEEQYCKQMEEKQQVELILRGLEIELRTLKNHLKQVEEERNETQRQLAQEQNARVLQESILNTHLWKQKELEEESKKTAAKHSEMTDSHDQEKELLHKNQKLQDELAVLKLELDHIRIRHQEEESKYLEENETLKEKTEELKKELKLNEEALTQTVFQYNGQINVSKTEVAMLTSKLEHIKENKERLEVELDSFRSRLSSAVQELERSQLSKSDLERMLQRERDEWLRLKDKLDHELCTLRETNNSMSQHLSKAESKANSLENELHHVTHSLREKSLQLESSQRDLSQAQGQRKELENARQVEKDQMNKYAVKQESMQERLAQLQSENLLLRQQFEDFQNKGIIKEKVVTDVQDRFNDIFSKLRADTEKQVQMMEERNKELIAKCNNLREQVFKYETEKVDREGTLRQLQQELADSLKKQSMSEASLEVSTRYRIDLEEDKQQLQKEIDRIKSKLQESEEQYLQSERRTHDLRNSLDAKEREASLASQKLQDLLVASSGANNAIKQLEEHIQRVEIENARLEATTNQQTSRIEILQKDLQDSASVHNRLEELITGLQTTKINLEEQLNHQVQKQTMLSVTAQDTHTLWEEELKSRSKLGVRLSELDREKAELLTQLENERKKVKKLVELKRSVEIRLDQEMKRNCELQKECNGIKKLMKTTKKKLKEYESGESSSQVSFHGEIKNRYSEIDMEVGKLRTKVDELSHHLEVESARCTQLESTNRDLHEQLSSMKILHKNHEKLEKSKLHLEEEVANLKQHVQGSVIDLKHVEQYKRDIEERARQEIRQKLEEVNLFLQTQAASQETLEQIRATSNASLRNQLENRIRDLESELAKLKSSQQDNILQKESTHTELERYKGLYSEEIKMRKSLGSKLDRANEKLAEANARLFHERHKSKTLLANSFISGSLSSGPVLETVQLGNIGSNLALNRPLSLGGGFMTPTGNPLASKNRVEAYLAKMQLELEKNITKELDQAKAELDAGSVRVSPIGSVDGSSKNLNVEQDQISKATQQYLDVLKKNYMI
ncbi:ankyrin repeat domain-containing protein 26-like [Elgaria multicarinata webbii]|uniref:ankyrin repeat domain-containing protein 26-like n=1 Tax=Elgaria multicarinata webbii TaxID=159646 RepID=UPI002FCCE2E3